MEVLEENADCLGEAGGAWLDKGQWCHCNISSGNGLENMYDISFLIAIINLIEEQMIEVAKAAAQPRHTWNLVSVFFFWRQLLL